MDHGQKSSFSKYIEFATFIKCNIGLPFVPLDRLQEGLDVLYNLAIKLPKNFTRFLARFMIHFEKTWIEGNFPPQTWNYFLFHGSTTNNFNEGVNRKLSGDVMETKPNPYKAVAKFKKIFVETADDATQCVERILNKIAKPVNKTYAGLKSTLQRFRIYFFRNPRLKGVESTS